MGTGTTRRARRTGAKFDLTFDFFETGAGHGPPGLEGSIEYAADLFDRASVERFAARFVRLLDGLCTDLDRPLSAVDLLTPSERHEVIAAWNDTGAGPGFPKRCPTCSPPRWRRTPTPRRCAAPPVP